MDTSLFGISEKALQLSEDRASLLSDNIVNSTTPNYKAKDIDFHKLLRESSQAGESLDTDNAGQISSPNDIGGAPIMYRVPTQKSLDGNTVDEEAERKNFIENALHYQVNLTFIQNKSDELMNAIKGE